MKLNPYKRKRERKIFWQDSAGLAEYFFEKRDILSEMELIR
jgi:hypothetical protein